MNQLALGLDDDSTLFGDDSAQLRAEKDAVRAMLYVDFVRGQRRYGAHGPVLLGGAVELYDHGNPNRCAIRPWWAPEPECGFAPSIPEGVRSDPPKGYEALQQAALDGWDELPWLPDQATPPPAALGLRCRCRSVDGYALHLYEHGLVGALSRIAGYTGTLWDSIRLELRRYHPRPLARQGWQG